MGWGGGLSTKVAWLDATNADYRQILEQFHLQTRLGHQISPSQTRRIVFLGNRPATLPDWVELAVE
jgi:hypothetical protein